MWSLFAPPISKRAVRRGSPGIEGTPQERHPYARRQPLKDLSQTVRGSHRLVPSQVHFDKTLYEIVCSPP